MQTKSVLPCGDTARNTVSPSDLTGRYVSPPGTGLGARGLPSSYPYHQETLWEVVKPIRMEVGLSAPWKDSPGMGIQYRMQQTEQELWDAGALRPIGGQ